MYIGKMKSSVYLVVPCRAVPGRDISRFSVIESFIFRMAETEETHL